MMKRTTNKVSGDLISVYLMAIIYCSSEAENSYLFALNIFLSSYKKSPSFFKSQSQSLLSFFCIDFSLLFKCITKHRLRFLILFLLIIKLFHLKSQHFFRGCFCGWPLFLLHFFLSCFPDHFINLNIWWIDSSCQGWFFKCTRFISTEILWILSSRML